MACLFVIAELAVLHPLNEPRGGGGIVLEWEGERSGPRSPFSADGLKGNTEWTNKKYKNRTVARREKRSVSWSFWRKL